MGLQIGDYIKITEDKGMLNQHMRSYIGKIATITDVLDEGIPLFKLDLDFGWWNWYGPGSKLPQLENFEIPDIAFYNINDIS